MYEGVIFVDKLIDSIKNGLSIAVTEAGKLTKTVVGKTNNLVDTTKLNIALNETNKKVYINLKGRLKENSLSSRL